MRVSLSLLVFVPVLGLVLSTKSCTPFFLFLVLFSFLQGPASQSRATATSLQPARLVPLAMGSSSPSFGVGVFPSLSHFWGGVCACYFCFGLVFVPLLGSVSLCVPGLVLCLDQVWGWYLFKVLVFTGCPGFGSGVCACA